jgi:hypothetical protein
MNSTIIRLKLINYKQVPKLRQQGLSGIALMMEAKITPEMSVSVTTHKSVFFTHAAVKSH